MDRVREFLQVDAGASVVAKTTTSAGGAAFGMEDPNQSKLLVDEGYRKNVIIYACINIIARTASEPDLVVARLDADGNRVPIEGKGDQKARQLQALLDKPNREQSQYDWLERALIELGYSGNSITHKVRTKGGKNASKGAIAELWQLTPYRTKLHLGEDNLPASYQFPIDQPGHSEKIPAADIVHIKRHDPSNEHWGLSALLVAARAGDLDNMGTEYLRTMFHNLGEPSALLIFKEIKNRKQHQHARDLWKETHGSDAGWHQIGTLDSAVEWKEVGSRPNDMALEGVFTHSETRICAAFGVPPILVGTATGLARSTYSNYREALRDLWTDTIVPMYTRVGDKFTHSIASEYDDRLVIFFDTSKVGALQDDRKDLREFALQAWETSLLPRNRALGLAQVELVEEGVRGDAYKHEETTAPQPMTLERSKQAAAYFDTLRALPLETLKLPPKVWRKIDRLADNAAPALASAFMRAVSKAQSSVSLLSLEQALRNNDAPTAEAALVRAWQDQLGALRGAFEPPLTKLFVVGSDVGDEQLARATVKLDVRASEVLKVSELEADAWVAAHLGELIEGVSEGTRNAIRVAVMQLGKGASIKEVAKGIRDRVGLTKRWIDFLEKKSAEGMSAPAVTKLTEQLIQKRAVDIALNEGRRAASEGQEFVWQRARKEGILKGNARMFWITAGDSEVCPICQPMDGQERRIGETFEAGSGEQVRVPPDPHPGCRCARGIRMKQA